MREVVFKELTSLESRKKNILLREVFEKDGVVSRTERRVFYFIKDISAVSNGANLQELVALQKTGGPVGRRHFHILREHNDALGEDKVVCKILGMFYAIVGDKVYTIAFLNSFKVTFMKAPLTG